MKYDMKKNDYLKGMMQAFLLCLLTAGAVFIPSIIAGGGLLTMGDDFDAQELAFQMLAGRALKTGNVFFNWSIDIGSDLISSFSFYNLGSPFFYLTLLFSAEQIPYLIGPILILKYGVAGVCAYIWFRSVLDDRRNAVVCSVLYAFSGFQATNMVFYHFHDAVAFFPLLLWGLDKCVQEKKRGIFAAVVALNALVNWNFFIAEVLFIILYYFVRYNSFSLKSGDVVKAFFLELLRVFLEGTLGVMASAVLLFPTIRSMLYLDRIGDTIRLKDAFIFSLKDILLNIKGMLLPADAMNNQSLFERFNWYSISSYVPMVGIAGSLAWILYSRGKKNWLSRMLILCVLISMIPGLNNAFVMFNREPYRRWYYMPILLMCLASGKIFEALVSEVKVSDTKNGISLSNKAGRSCYRILMISCGITIGATVLLPFFFKAVWPLLKLEMLVLNRFNVFLLFAIAGAGVATLCAIGFAYHKQMIHQIYLFLAVGAVIFSFFSTANTFREYKQSAFYSPKEV